MSVNPIRNSSIAGSPPPPGADSYAHLGSSEFSTVNWSIGLTASPNLAVNNGCWWLWCSDKAREAALKDLLNIGKSLGENGFFWHSSTLSVQNSQIFPNHTLNEVARLNLALEKFLNSDKPSATAKKKAADWVTALKSTLVEVINARLYPPNGADVKLIRQNERVALEAIVYARKKLTTEIR